MSSEREGGKVRRTMTILKNTSGASLMFVLGIMLLLLAVGTSVLTAASATVGANVRQNNFNAAMQLSDSIHRNIMHSIMMSHTETDFEDSLAYQLVWALYEADTVGEPLDEIELEIEIDGTAVDADVTLSFPFSDVRIIEAVPAMPELGILRIHSTASINARVVVNVEIAVDTFAIGEADRRITAQAVFDYTGGELSDEAAYNSAPPGATPPSGGFPRTFTTDGYGTWELLSYEIVQTEVDS